MNEELKQIVDKTIAELGPAPLPTLPKLGDMDAYLDHLRILVAKLDEHLKPTIYIGVWGINSTFCEDWCTIDPNETVMATDPEEQTRLYDEGMEAAEYFKEQANWCIPVVVYGLLARNGMAEDGNAIAPFYIDHSS